MVTEDFIRDLSEYLLPGTWSDLTLIFGEKSWQIHKALACCHSKWFRKAATSGFDETKSGVVTLNDDPGFANAIDCMVSYFYTASYNIAPYDTSESLLHAQVATIADKHDCATLYKLARTSFANTINVVKGDDWLDVAALIYDHTTTDLPAHKELRSLVVAAIANRPVVMKSIFQLESTAGLLRSTADLATDLLLSGLHSREMQDVAKQIFVCGKCRYAHAGSRGCSYVTQRNIADTSVCPICENYTGAASKKFACVNSLVQAYPCPSCEGIHTLKPEPNNPPLSEMRANEVR